MKLTEEQKLFKKRINKDIDMWVKYNYLYWHIVDLYNFYSFWKQDTKNQIESEANRNKIWWKWICDVMNEYFKKMELLKNFKNDIE